jgi:hypothetical protein
MDNREARFILNAYRPGGQDASDPRFAEALEQARRDPVLERWFVESIAFDAAITEKLCAVPVPGNLREGILAGAKISRTPHWKKRLRKWAIAAAVVLGVMVGSLIWHNTRPAPLAGWQVQALDVISSLVRNESTFDAQSANAGELLAWLRANHAPAAQQVPNNLGKLESIGCKRFSWGGIPVSVVCFKRPAGGLIHLITTNALTPSARPVATAPEFVQQGEWATATWRDGDATYMLALEGSYDQLRWYLL